MRRATALLILTFATLAAATCRHSESTAPDRPTNLVFVTFDTTRRDHLSTYGYERPTAPNLDRLAAGGVVFENAFTADANTSPSHTAIFTGLYPHENGNQANGMWLTSDHLTLAEILRNHGFDTGAFIGGLTLKKVTGLGKGFDEYDDRFPRERRDGDVVTTLALDWLSKRPPDKPYFLFLHLFDAHGPYRPKPPFASMFNTENPGPEVAVPPYQQIREKGGAPIRNINRYVDRYDAQIRYVDHQFGRLLSAINTDNTLVVVFADHGETLGERDHALDHGCQPFDEQIRIPLVMAGPGIPRRHLAPMVQTVDILPTILELFGIEVPELTPSGRSLASLLKGEGIQPLKFVHTTARADAARYPGKFEALDENRRIISIRSRHWKLIEYPSAEGDHLELYDLDADPAESRNVLAEHEDIARSFLGELRRWNPDYRRRMKRPTMSSEYEKQLRSLGYLGGN